MIAVACRRIALPSTVSASDSFMLRVLWDAAPRERILIAGERMAWYQARFCKIKRDRPRMEYFEARGAAIRERLKASEQARGDVRPEFAP